MSLAFFPLPYFGSNAKMLKIQRWHGSCCLSRGGNGAMRENREKWIEFCAQAANEQDSEKLMELIKQITALLDAKQQRLIERDTQRLKSERTD